MLRVDYRPVDQRAVVGWDEAESPLPWIPILHDLLGRASDDSQVEGGTRISLPWWSFVGVRGEFGEFLRAFDLRGAEKIEVSERAGALLRRSSENVQAYDAAVLGGQVDEGVLVAKLAESGFDRVLKPHQIRNIRKLASLPAGATFSVPGAGKTTEALATFAFRREAGDRLLVIAPKNAFAAWDEQLKECFPGGTEQFVRLRGGNIGRLLQEDATFMIVSYQQVPRSREILTQHIASRRVHVYLDESHRIKSGAARLTANAVLSVAQLPVGKLVMSGTPMPQATEDLLPQLAFLYPELQVNAANVVDKMRPIYVRTTKAELGLKPPTILTKSVAMSPLQTELYGYMRSEVARQAAVYLSDRSKGAFRSLGRSVTRLLMFVSHPALLSRELDHVKPGLLAAVVAEGRGPKLNYVLARTRALAKIGKKVLIWSSYRNNVEYIAESLADLGAVYIHGSVDAGDEDDDATREGRIKLFHDDQNVRVLVANPAAASEGISLHKVCHHAIYLDRTFNAAHFLQSMDRIHRLGLAPDQDTTIEIVECTMSVDQTVAWRLGAKINAMATALNDTSLRIDPIPMDDPGADDDWAVGGLDFDDVQALLRDLSRESE